MTGFAFQADQFLALSVASVNISTPFSCFFVYIPYHYQSFICILGGNESCYLNANVSDECDEIWWNGLGLASCFVVSCDRMMQPVYVSHMGSCVALMPSCLLPGVQACRRHHICSHILAENNSASLISV